MRIFPTLIFMNIDYVMSEYVVMYFYFGGFDGKSILILNFSSKSCQEGSILPSCFSTLFINKVLNTLTWRINIENQ